MSDNTEEQITQNVLDSMAQTSNPRLKAVMTSLIRHLHAFVREVDLTEEEWMAQMQERHQSSGGGSSGRNRGHGRSSP